MGDSMEPTLLAGDRLLVAKWRGIPVRQIIVLRDPRSSDDIVKRLLRRSRSSVWVEGDNPSRSTDSRQLGWFPRKGVVGWAVYRYYPPDRVGSLVGE
ncbi:S26 family signal peptidase [Ferrimicrobium acidiphilum]|uniref:S26 family signal peptidase n=1 Tax=Ferrimicrobium acidiphilum TaxID=121039 RepID=UPI0034DEA8E6